MHKKHVALNTYFKKHKYQHCYCRSNSQNNNATLLLNTFRCISKTIPLFSSKSADSTSQTLTVCKQNKCKICQQFCWTLLNYHPSFARGFSWNIEWKYCDLNSDCNLSKSPFPCPWKFRETNGAQICTGNMDANGSSHLVLQPWGRTDWA